MKKIKICFLDFWSGFDYKIMNFYNALLERYEVFVCNNQEDADYIFFSCFGNEHWHVAPNKIKIFVTAENVCPDFNNCDYAIGFEWLDFGDRYLRLSNAYSATKYKEVFDEVRKKHEESLSELKKDSFCSFVVSNGNAEGLREQLFKKLSEYKKVNSGGRYLNNVGGPVDNKLAFEKKHKFSICCENSSHSGYTTEKIFQAFAAHLIPIYWGDPDVCKVINPKSFINVADFSSLEEVVEKVRQIDNDEDLYKGMISEPVLLNPARDDYNSQLQLLKEFMWHIFDQHLSEAYRYNRHVTHFYHPFKISKLLKTPLYLLLAKDFIIRLKVKVNKLRKFKSYN